MKAYDDEQPSDQCNRPRRRPQQRWTLDSIDWAALRHDAVAGNEALFYLIAGASFIEAATDLYTQNLIDYFSGDDEITDWLKVHWLPEELQHGQRPAALRPACLARFRLGRGL